MKKLLVSGVLALGLSAAGLVTVAGPAAANTQCTYTQGYYKNHLNASYDLNYDLKYDSGLLTGILSKTGVMQSGSVQDALVAVLSLPSSGPDQVAIIAAKQVIAAALNGSAGESGLVGEQSAVGDAFRLLLGYFNGTATPTRDQVLAAAATLDAYNNGRLNLPHCS